MRRREALAGVGLASLAPLVAEGGGATQPSAGGPRSRHFPNLLLCTHQGQTVRFYDDLIAGKIVTINFMYAECTGICPGMTANLLKLQAALGPRVGRDVFMYSLTLQPDHDTPAVLKQYAESHHVGPGWLFLTGSRPDIETLRRSLGFVDPDPVVDADKSEHIGLVRIGNDRLDRWTACPALAKPEQLVEVIGWMAGGARPG
jgi:protein SCO1/2